MWSCIRWILNRLLTEIQLGWKRQATGFPTDQSHISNFKTLEGVVDRFLNNTILMERRLPNGQFAFREGRCTETELHYIVAEVEEQMKSAR